MSIIRVQQHKNYTVMSNTHLRDKNLSLKAKGLMSQMLSLPPDWDFTVSGLVSINKEAETAITGALKELKEFGYLVVQKRYPGDTTSGRIEYEYVLYEEPQGASTGSQPLEFQGPETQDTEIQDLENLPLENVGQLNTDYKLLTNKETEEINTENREYMRTTPAIHEKRKKYGDSGWVLLTDEEYRRLLNDLGEAELKRCIAYIDESAQITGNKNKWKDWNRVIRRCSREGWGKGYVSRAGGAAKKDFKYDYDDEEVMPF